MKPCDGADIAFPAPGRGTLGRSALRPIVFLAVEGVAELCRQRLCATLHPPEPWSPGAIGAVCVLVWSFEAHDRLTFRDAAAAGLERLAPFCAVGLAALIALQLAARVSAEALAVVWAAVLGLKFTAIRTLVWRPATTGKAAAA